METLGQRLKKAREEKGITIEQAHSQTKIQQHTLISMEEDKFKDIAASVYVKGFLKKYAQFLGLDGEGLVREYEQLYPSSKEVKMTVESEQLLKEAGKRSFPVSLTAVISGAVLIILLAIIISWTLTHRKKTPTEVAAKKSQKTAIVQKEAVDLLVPKTEPLRLIISTKDDVWIQAKCDGKVMFQNILPKGGMKKLMANDDFELWFGKADVVSLSLNGHMLGSPGRGIVKGVKVTREGIKR